MKILAAAAFAVAVTMATATVNATANATQQQYLQRAQEVMPYVFQQYGAQALVTEGYRICAYEARGITGASELADRIVSEMPMSQSAAIELQVLAEMYLGC